MSVLVLSRLCVKIIHTIDVGIERDFGSIGECSSFFYDFLHYRCGACADVRTLVM